MTTTKTGYRLIAYISRAKGLKGEVVVQAATDLPLSLLGEGELWVVPPLLEGVRTTRLLELKAQAKDTLALLEGVSDGESARALVGHYLMGEVTREALPSRRANGNSPLHLAEPVGLTVGARCHAPAEEGETFSSFVGFTVVDAACDRVIGSVRELREGTAQDLWVVDTPEGEVLIPAVEAFIAHREDDASATRTLYLNLPEGLLELNRRSS